MKGQQRKRQQDSNVENVTKRKKYSKNISNHSNKMMDEAFLRFPHLPEEIFKTLA